jgi:hypothetical protein
MFTVSFPRCAFDEAPISQDSSPGTGKYRLASRDVSAVARTDEVGRSGTFAV